MQPQKSATEGGRRGLRKPPADPGPALADPKTPGVSLHADRRLVVAKAARRAHARDRAEGTSNLAGRPEATSAREVYPHKAPYPPGRHLDFRRAVRSGVSKAKRKHPLLKPMKKVVVAVLGLVVCLLSSLSAQEGPQQYAAGQFPDGPRYGADQLGALIDQPLAQPAYLVGKLVYLKRVDVWEIFCNYDLKSPMPPFGRALVAVRFFDNAPRGLAPGKLIDVFPAEPLALRRVGRADDGAPLAVAECWSLPAP